MKLIGCIFTKALWEDFLSWCSKDEYNLVVHALVAYFVWELYQLDVKLPFFMKL